MRLRCSIFRRLTWFLLVPLLISVIGCGSTVRIAGALNTSNVQTATGTVSFVHFTAIFDSSGTLVNVTVVTLVVPFGTKALTFCGNQTSQFQTGASVQIGFTAGQTCSMLNSVVPH